MTQRRSRRLQVASLALCLCVGIAITWWWKSRVTLRPNPLANVPASALAFVHIRWPELRASALWQDVVVARDGDRALRALEAECGFDWSADLVSVSAFAHTAPQGDVMLPEHVAFILTGPLQLERMVDCISPASGELEARTLEGVQAFAAGEYHAAVLDDGALLVGHVDALRAVIRTVQGTEQSLADLPALRSAFALVSPDRHLSAALQLDARWQHAFEEALEEQAGEREQAPQFVVAGARVTRGLTFGALAHFDSPSEAQALETRLSQLRDDMAAQFAVALSPLGPALRSVSMQSEENELHLAFDLDARRIGELIRLQDEQIP